MPAETKTPTISLSIQKHNGEERLFADFSYNTQLIQIIKEVPGSRWSRTKKQWHFNLNHQVVELLKQKTESLAALDASLLKTQWKELEEKEKKEKFADVNEETVKALDYYKLWMEQKRYSPQTVKNYMGQITQFLRYYQPKSFKDLIVEDVERYNHEVIIKNGLSVSFQKGMIGSIKLFFTTVQGSKMNLDKLQRPFNESKLPDVLSKEEVQDIIKATNNIKHKALLSFIYSCGLRIGEALALELKHLDKDRKLIKIVQAKGKKDRYVPYSDKLRLLLRT